MEVTSNQIYKLQNKGLIPNTFRKGIISAIYTSSFTADISFIKNNQTIIRGVPLAKNVDITQIKVGDRCKVDIFDSFNPSDMVLSYTY